MFYAIISVNNKLMTNSKTGQAAVYSSFKEAAENIKYFKSSDHIEPVRVIPA